MRQAAVLAFAVMVATAPLNAEPTADRLETSLEALDRWLGEDRNGQRWRNFLHTRELRDQLAAGQSADRERVEKILSIYESETPGLDRRMFGRVRADLREWSEQLPPSVPELADQLAGKSDDYEAVTAEQVARRRQELSASLRELGAFLASGDAQNAAQWREYLGWGALEADPAAAEPANFRPVQIALGKFYARHPGLELPQFTEVRHQLRRYLDVASFHYQPQIEALFAQRVEALAERLRSYQEGRSVEDAQLIGRIVGWLDGGGQLPELVEEVRQHYWQPNLRASVSEQLVAASLADAVDRTQAVNEVILGTSLYGSARLQADVTADLVPHDTAVCFDIEMSGYAASDNVGYNGPVTLYTNGLTQVYARKRVYFDETGVWADPAVANCSTSSTINRIAARSKLIRKIAWKRAGRTKPQSEWVASRRAEARIAGEMDSQAVSMLAEADERFEEKLRDPLVRFDAFPRRFQVHTAGDRFSLQLTQVADNQLAAPEAPPAAVEDTDLAVQLHESWLGNLSESLVGGRTVTDEQLADLLADAGTEVPPELQSGPETDPWSISFVAIQPIRAEFRDGRVRIAIRGRRFTRGEQEVRSNIEISATYRLERVGQGSKFTREGDVEVDYVDQQRLSVSQVAMKTFLRKKFEGLFEPEITSDGLELPGQWAKVGTLRLVQLAAADQWLSLSWRMNKDTIRTADAP